jgi:hypothetical protein
MEIKHHLLTVPGGPSDSIYGVSIFRACDDGAVVVLTEPGENLGMSITNAIEQVANLARDMLLESLPPKHIVWIERFEELGTFDYVCFQWNGKQFFSPDWRPIGDRDERSFWWLIFGLQEPACAFPRFSLERDADLCAHKSSGG